MPNISPEMQNGPIKGSNTVGFTLKLIPVGF